MKKFLARLGKLTTGLMGAVLIAVFISGLVMVFSLTPAHDRLEYVFYDLRFRLKPKPEPLPELALINVDDASISARGVYPWPRHYYAYAIRQLKAVGLSNLIFDFQFIDSSPPLLNPDGFNTLYSALAAGQSIVPDDLFTVMIDNDRDLAMATEEFNGTIMPFSFAKVESKASLSPEAKALMETAIARFNSRASLPLPTGKEARFRALADADRVAINYPIPELMNASDHFGFVDNDVDLDGAHRRVRLVRVFGDRMYFHLSLVGFLRMCGVGLESVEVNPGKAIVIRNAVHPVTGRKGDIEIPVDGQCSMYFDWMGDFAATARSVPANAVLEYSFQADQFEMQLMLKDMASGNGARVELTQELEALKAAITTEPDFEKKFSLRQEYRKKLDAYRLVIKGYLDESQAELDGLLALRESGGEVDDESIASIRDLITAIGIKTQVEYLFDSVAVMGLTATGTQDEGVTPLSNSYWMVGSYPTAINTLARGNFIQKPPMYLEFACMLVLAIGLASFIHDRSAKVAYTAIGIAAILVNAAILALFFKLYVWVDQLSFNLALLLPAALIMVTKFAGEEENRQFIQGAFSKYLSQDVIDQIIANPDALKLGGESCTITTFFSDIRGFSSISERLSPEGLVHLLNEYLSEMTDTIMRNRGTIDKYEGDAIMAFWGAPLSFPEHPYLACLSALEMNQLGSCRGWKHGFAHPHELHGDGRLRKPGFAPGRREQGLWNLHHGKRQYPGFRQGPVPLPGAGYHTRGRQERAYHGVRTGGSGRQGARAQGGSPGKVRTGAGLVQGTPLEGSPGRLRPRLEARHGGCAEQAVLPQMPGFHENAAPGNLGRRVEPQLEVGLSLESALDPADRHEHHGDDERGADRQHEAGLGHVLYAEVAGVERYHVGRRRGHEDEGQAGGQAGG
jgi:adenylate cyclase